MKTLIATLVAFMACSSWAGLGGKPANLGAQVSADRSHKLSHGVGAYTDVEKTLDSGTTVHQYLDAKGTVFAVSWSGPFPPDYKELLGSYFEAFRAHAANSGGPGAGSMTLKGSDLVIVSGGHMGAFKGQAWLPSKLPAGFKPGDIQ